MKISLVIPVFNALKDVKVCIKSVLKNFDFSLGEVLIIDDFSENDTKNYLLKIAEKYKDKLTLQRNSENLGWLKTCNNAVKFSNNEIIVLLNSDCVIPKNFCPKIIKCFEADIDIVTASPIASATAQNYIPLIFPINVMNRLLERRKPTYPDLYNSDGFCFCVRKDYINNVRNGLLFDPIYNKGYCEEVDFCFDVQTHNKRTVLIDDLYLIHKRHKSFKGNKAKYLTENNKIFYSKWGDLITNKECQVKEKPPIIKIINETFGRFAIFIKLLRKLKGQISSNRILTLRNIFKKYENKKSLRKVIYTCISGKYDILPIIQDYYAKDWKYVCFTNNKTLLKLGKIGMWELSPMQYTNLDSTKNARWHKTHPHILFPEYEESIWIDANINILTNYLFEEINNKNSDILVPIHYCRSCIYKEFGVVEALGKDSEENSKNTLKFIKEQNMPENYGMNETNIIYRKHHNPKIQKIIDDWWFIIENYTKRDQLSFSYILWKNNIKVQDISIDNARIDKLNFNMYSHNPTRTITGKILSLIFR